MRRYSYLPQSPGAAQIQDANGVYYVHNNNVHTATMLSGAAGQVVWRAKYAGYGEAVVEDDADGNGTAVVNEQRFPGQLRDAESGLHYNFMRYFDPALGRYIEADPTGLHDEPNIYAYAQGRPTSLAYPLGLYMWGDVINAYRHYCDGTGTPWSVAFMSLSWELDPATGMKQYVERMAAGLGGYCQDQTIPLDYTQGFQTKGADAYLIGRHSFRLTGALMTGCDCSYSFSGTVKSAQGWEDYNFNASNRSMPKEIATAIGRNGCRKGRSFRINITGSQSVQASGQTGGTSTCCKM